ncbi:MAG: dipeptidase [Phycisphaeraceae bacterium]|nr:dipeptidase [Phycisphaeraceae bacterium]
MNTKVLRQIDQQFDESVERLIQWLSIPSVSTDPNYKGEIADGAAWLVHELTELGFDADAHPTDGHPCIVARPRSGDPTASPDAPTVLFYGHYDVQPPDPLELWDSGPFEPTIHNHAIVARGASDDKGQVMTFIEALRAWKQVEDRLPVNVILLIEGEEECGSVNLPPFIEAHASSLKADFVLISDTQTWDDKTLSITCGLRGLVYFDVQLHGPTHDLHSGTYGGTVPNPATILMRVLSSLWDERHRITIPGFYDDVAAPSEAELKDWESLNFDEARFLRSIGINEGHGEEGYSLLERRWTRPSLEINGLYGGYMGEGAKTIIPAMAGAKLSFRIPPDQDPERVSTLFEKWLQAQPVHGLRWMVKRYGAAAPVSLPRNSPWLDAAKRACEATSGRPAVLVREGATIPIVADFKRILGLDSILIGFGRHNDRIHAPNEKFDLESYKLGIRTHATLLAELAAGSR